MLKLWGVLAACTVLGLFAASATPSTAHVPPDNNVNFNPDEHNGAGDPGNLGGGSHTKEAEVISDAQDGFGTAYELRAVADSQTAFYEWYDCEDNTDPTAAGPHCAPVVTDTAPDPAPAPPGESPAASFAAPYDVPQSSNGDHVVEEECEGPCPPGSARDVYGFACQSDAAGGPPADTGDCVANDAVPPSFEGDCAFAPITESCVADVHMDNAQGTDDHPATTNGRIHMLVTSSRTFIHPDVHGAGLKNGESLTVIAFTSAGGVDAVHVCLDQFSDDETANDLSPNGDGTGCTHNGTDTSSTPGGGSGCHASAPTAAGGDCWAVTVGVPIANTVFGASLIEIDDDGLTDGGDAEGSTFGTGDCEGSTGNGSGDDCQLDKVYITTTPEGETISGPPPPGPAAAPERCNRIRGTAEDDKLKGTPGCDIIRGRGGDDVLRGKRGDDRLRGGGGNDVARGGPGNDLCRAEEKHSC